MVHWYTLPLSGFNKPHNALKEEFMKDGNYLGSDDQHIIENENFRKVDPERDLKRWEATVEVLAVKV
jgi:hypothetical protein